MKRTVTFVSLLMVCVGAAQAFGQEYPLESNISFQVWNGSVWANSTSVYINTPVQWRTVVSYTGTRTDLVGLGRMTYQPTFQYADNSGSGTTIDQIGTLRSDRVLTSAEAASSGHIATGYGRVNYGSTSTTTSLNNILTLFRHTGGTANAPAGSWMRIAGSYVSNWPTYPLTTPPGADAINRITRGVTASQVSYALAPSPWVGGTNNLVVFRGEFTPSNLPGSVTLSTFVGSFIRTGNAFSGDDRRYMTWQTSLTDIGSYRTSLSITPATITVIGAIPAPGAAAILGLGMCCVARRRARA